jgi:hypothetical protein
MAAAPLGFILGEGACILAEPCGAGEATGLAAAGVIVGTFYVVSEATLALHNHFSKKEGEQTLINEVAKEKGVNARKLGDAIEEEKKGLDKGAPDLSRDDIRKIADQMKAGDYWSPK